MKRQWFIFISMFFSTVAVAGNGFYETIPYYNNDPFTFCTVGVPQDCWLPVSKELGTYTVTSYHCFNPYSATMFSRVCPKAFNVQRPPKPSSMTAKDPANADS